MTIYIKEPDPSMAGGFELREATLDDYRKYLSAEQRLEIGQSAIVEKVLCGEVITSPVQMKLYLSNKLSLLEREVFVVFFGNSERRIIHEETMFKGTLSSCPAKPRAVLKRALELNSSCVWFAHNHPSGASEPSQADRRVTRHFQDALNLFEVDVLDHLVVGNGSITSFSERGWI
ncbi:hypothetical protein L1D14_23035 [Vibrio tubiashii]|nr:JAB domain-containing protein [Vibrio tubiashii]MCG9579080.1 hypothetical protein [Vibrio tubiashii]